MGEHYEATVYLNGSGNAPIPDEAPEPVDVSFEMMAELVNAWLVAAVETEAIRQKYNVTPDDIMQSLAEGPTLTDLYVSVISGITSVTPDYLRQNVEEALKNGLANT